MMNLDKHAIRYHGNSTTIRGILEATFMFHTLIFSLYSASNVSIIHQNHIQIKFFGEHDAYCPWCVYVPIFLHLTEINR